MPRSVAERVAFLRNAGCMAGRFFFLPRDAFLRNAIADAIL